jgi:hypothetical protein
MAAKKAVSKRSGKPSTEAPVVPPVQERGPTSGVPTFVGKSRDPKMLGSKPRKSRAKTRTGKNIDPKTGQVFKPKVTRGEDGKIRSTTAEEQEASRVTVLPTAGPKATTRGNARQGMGERPVTKGFAVAYPVVEAAVHAALHHLTGMHTSQPNSPEYHEHHEAFNLIHANILKMSPELHTSLGQAKHEITHPSAKTAEALAMTHSAITSRLAIGKAAYNDNLKRSGKGENK